MLVLGAVDRGFESRSDQIKYYIIGIDCFSANHAARRRKSKEWLVRNQDHVSKCSDTTTHRLLFQLAEYVSVFV